MARLLLQWFDRQARTLPWRENRDPYRVWLSEIMLQQTRVETVIPYFHRFLVRLPTVEALAAAPVEEVLALWSGLGYYRRARQLHAAAQEIQRRGEFPRTLEGLRELPGIGPYTAAAVGSIAFGIVEPVLDGNVERVLSRVLALDEDPKGKEGRRILTRAAAALLDRARPGDSNQALMELGATVCTATRPSCLLCPLSKECLARQRMEVDRYPRRRQRRATEQVRLVAVVCQRQDGSTLLFRRPEDATLLAGTWEVPWAEARSSGKGAGGEVERALGQRYGGRWSLGEKRGEAKHAITFRALRVAVHEGERVGMGRQKDGAAEEGWFSEEEIAGLATSSLVMKVLKLIGRPS